MPKIKPARSAAQRREILMQLAVLYPQHPLDVAGRDNFYVLVSAMLSSRTKDPVTNGAMQRLWAQASTPQQLLLVPEAELAQLLKPVGFYSQKAGQLLGLCQRLIAEYGGQVPATREELMTLPGVGRKVANLVLNICFNAPAICVDTHVHRISNRLGWVQTTAVEETEQALLAAVPDDVWTILNRVLVNHGQQVCHPLSPRCSVCPIAADCPRLGVGKSR
jgi:endonuclease III